MKNGFNVQNLHKSSNNYIKKNKKSHLKIKSHKIPNKKPAY